MLEQNILILFENLVEVLFARTEFKFKENRASIAMIRRKEHAHAHARHTRAIARIP